MRDPVWGVQVAPERAAGSLEHGGTTYYFCGHGCLEKFRPDPARNAGASPAPAAEPHGSHHGSQR